jgi:hypothetical protein
VPVQALVLVLDEPRLAAVRERFYPAAAARGVPFHLTLLYPFGGDVGRAREVVAAHAPFRFELTRLATFHGGFAVALPEPGERIRSLQKALWDAFPEWPPYGGEVVDPEPHATLAADGLSLELRAAAEPLLPATVGVDHVALIGEAGSGAWELLHRLPLQARSSA